MGALLPTPPYIEDIDDLYSPENIDQTALDFANMRNYTVGSLIADAVLTKPGDKAHFWDEVAKYTADDLKTIENTVRRALADPDDPKQIKFRWNPRSKIKQVRVDEQDGYYLITIDGYTSPEHRPRPRP